MADDRPISPRAPGAAHTAVLAVAVILLVAGVIAIFTGVISEKTFQIPEPRPDSVTIP